VIKYLAQRHEITLALFVRGVDLGRFGVWRKDGTMSISHLLRNLGGREVSLNYKLLWCEILRFSRQYKHLVSALLFGLAFSVRFLYILSIPRSFSFDEPYYQDIVSRLLTGQGYSFSSDAYHTAVAGQPTSFQEPIYPLFLSVLYTVFGLENHLAARLCQAVVGSLIPVMIFLLGEKVAVGKGIGLLAGLFLVAHPSLVYFSGLLMTETLFTFLLVASLYMLAWATEVMPGYRDVTFGMLIGLTALTRTVLIGFLPIIFLWLWLRSSFREALQRVLLTSVGCVALILPWTIRNILVHRAFIPLTTKGGYNIYIYSYPVRDYAFNDRWDVIAFPEMDGLSEVERARLLASQGRDYIRQNPLLFIGFAFRKLLDFWNPVPKSGSRLLIAANVVSFGGAAVFTLIGLVLLLIIPEMREPFVILLYALVGYYMLECMIFTGGMKARLPTEPIMMLLGVRGISSLLRCMHTGERIR